MINDKQTEVMVKMMERMLQMNEAIKKILEGKGGRCRGGAGLLESYNPKECLWNLYCYFLSVLFS